MASHPTNSTGSINPSNPCEYQLFQVLERANLLGYFNNFIQQGGDDVTQLCEASDDEFMEILSLVGMSNKPLHIRRLQKSLQEWAKENNVPFLQTQSATQPQLNSMPYASALVGLQPQSHTIAMGTQWGPVHQSTSNQWNASQPLASDQSSPSNSPQQNSPYTQRSMSQSPSQASQLDNSMASAADTDDYTDPRTLRQVAQRIMASHTPSPVNQTSQNRKLFNSVQHIIEMSADHPQRLEEIQKWAPIYGRFDSKRKDDKPLTAHEITVNEAAILLCCMDPYLVVQRDKLFPLARQVVRESGYQFKHGHSSETSACTSAGITRFGILRSLKSSHSKNDDSNGIKPKRLKVDSAAGSCRDTEMATPNPRTVQAQKRAEDLRFDLFSQLAVAERMNEILINLNSIVQKQSDIKASIAAARSEDNIQQVYDFKVQLEKLTTQQLLLMTEQTDLIKRQRRSDRYYVAKARAEENGDMDDRPNPQETLEDDSDVSEPEQVDDCGTPLQDIASTQSTSPAIEGARTLQDKQPLKKSGNSSLAQTLLMQHTLMNEGLRVAQNYALDTRGSSLAALSSETLQPQVKTECQDLDNREVAASLAAESTITALLSLSSNKNQGQDNREVNV